MSEMDLHDSLEETRLHEDPEVAVEAPEADALEQRTVVVPPAEDEPPTAVPPDVDPADRVEQERSVELDEDDYR